MTEDATHEEADDAGIWARSTAPQSPYTMRQVGIGIAIFVIGLLITVGIPLVLS